LQNNPKNVIFEHEFFSKSTNKKIKGKTRLESTGFLNTFISFRHIAGIEVNLRKVNDRIIKLIISEFGVNEDWLRFGNGDIFSERKTNGKSTRMVSLFNDLPLHYQDVILGTI